MDLWTRRDAPVERIKVEPEIHIDDDWVIYPIEVRVLDTVAPDAPSTGWPQGIAAAEDVRRGFVCGSQIPTAAPPKEATVASLRFRNAQQDRCAGRQGFPQAWILPSSVSSLLTLYLS